MSRKEKWERLMLRVDQLIGGSNSSLYQRVVLLKEIHDDPEFLAFHGQKIDKIEAHLDEKLGDYGISFYNALSLLKHFPTVEQWEKGKLREMLATALQAEDDARAETDTPRTQRKPAVPRKEHEQVLQQLEVAKSRGESLAEECQRLRSEMQSLRNENAELRNENAELRGRLKELERMVHRDLAAA